MHCAVWFHLLYFELVDHVSILLHWCSNKTVLSFICFARIVLITRKAKISESKNIIGTQQSILINVFAMLGFEYHRFPHARHLLWEEYELVPSEYSCGKSLN